jgi:hypothetical protein
MMAARAGNIYGLFRVSHGVEITSEKFRERPNTGAEFGIAGFAKMGVFLVDGTFDGVISFHSLVLSFCGFLPV